MKDRIYRLFHSDKGKKISKDIFRAMDDYKMLDFVKKGALVGFSGGADSVLLLSFLAYYSDFGKDFPIVALHVNHGIRGPEADRDEAFAKGFCNSLNIEFFSRKIDIPTIAAEMKMGLEECARKCRYSEFRKIIQGRNDISTICVAHNADDNLETVILNMLRGCGTRGMAGIPPVRENIVRPLLYVTKSNIVSALSEFEIPFVLDSTNSSNDYKRNYIRNNILPEFREISVSPEVMASRSSRNLRADDDYISSVAEEFLKTRERVKNTELTNLHEAVFSRVLSMMAKTSISSVNINEVKRLLSGDNFSYSLPEGKIFLCEYGICRVIDGEDRQNFNYTRKLSWGINRFDDFDSDVILSDGKCSNNFSNVYKFSIQVNLASAIIEGDLYLRPKKDGDSIRYGGITHKLKKLFNDRKIPPSVRNLIPVLCDDKGVVFVPGFGVRDDGVCTSEKKDVFLSICVGKGKALEDVRFYLGNEVYK